MSRVRLQLKSTWDGGGNTCVVEVGLKSFRLGGRAFVWGDEQNYSDVEDGGGRGYSGYGDGTMDDVEVSDGGMAGGRYLYSAHTKVAVRRPVMVI